MKNARNRRPGPLLAAALIVLTLFAAACGSSSESAAATTTEPTSTAESATPTVDPEPEAAPAEPTETPVVVIDVEEGESPIEALLGVPIFDDVALQKWFAELSVEAERVVATCMIGEGFEYTLTGITVATDSVGAVDTLEYAQTRGLGIIAEFNESEYDPATALPDANAEYLSTLSDAERDAYFVALQGRPEGDLAEGAGDPFGDEGCRGQATEEVFAVVGVMDEIAPVFEGYYDLYISDSRIIATTSEWQTCMAEAGYTFSDEDEMYGSIFRKLDTILDAPDAFVPFDIDDFSAAASSTGSDIHPPLTAPAQAEIDALGEEEISVAVANWTCREPIKDTELAVQREYENQFVAEVGAQVQSMLGS